MHSVTLMATPSSTSNRKTTAISSSFLKSICLHDWWLIKVDIDSKGRRLGVGGFASKERQGIRVFSSAAIAKRHNTTTLESVDGITITISGFINRLRTCQNGFPSEVCNQFLFGFPYYWEEYAAPHFGEGSTNRAVPSGMSSVGGFNMFDGSNSFFSIHDLAVTQVRDLFMSTCGEFESYVLRNSIFNDILQKYGGNISKDAESIGHLDEGINNQVTTRDSTRGETPSSYKKFKAEQKYKDDKVILTSGSQKKSKVKHKCKDDNGISDVAPMRVEENQKFIQQLNIYKDVQSLSNGVSTRSMTRFNNSKNKQEDDPLSNNSRKSELDSPISASKDSRGHQPQRIANGKRSSNVRLAACTGVKEIRERPHEDAGRVPCKWNMKYGSFPTSPASCEPILRRSTRLKSLEKLSQKDTHSEQPCS